MQIYQNNFMSLDFIQEKRLFYLRWLPSTNHMEHEDYKQCLSKYLEKVQEFRPLRVLIDDQEMHYTIVPEVQNWLAQDIFPLVIEAGLRLFAVVVSKDLVTQLGTEQAAEENPHPDKLSSAFFESEQEAEAWLLRHNFS